MDFEEAELLEEVHQRRPGADQGDDHAPAEGI